MVAASIKYYVVNTVRQTAIIAYYLVNNVYKIYSCENMPVRAFSFVKKCISTFFLPPFTIKLDFLNF